MKWFSEFQMRECVAWLVVTGILSLIFYDRDSGTRLGKGKGGKP